MTFHKAVCVLFLSLILSGCQQSNRPPKSVVTDFSAAYTAEYCGMTIRGALTYTRQGNLDLSITEPQTLDGLELSYRGNELSMGRDSLRCTADEAYLPDTSFSQMIRGALSEIGAEEANGTLKLSDGGASVGEWRIQADEEGFLTALDGDSLHLSLSQHMRL